LARVEIALSPRQSDLSLANRKPIAAIRSERSIMAVRIGPEPADVASDDVT
jgi:hypothetical protein